MKGWILFLFLFSLFVQADEGEEKVTFVNVHGRSFPLMLKYKFKNDYCIFSKKNGQLLCFTGEKEKYYSQKDHPNLYRKVQKAMDQLFEMFKEEYKVKGETVPKPHFYIGDEDSSHVVGVPTKNGTKLANVIKVDVKLAKATMDQLYGILAHELVHYFEKQMEGDPHKYIISTYKKSEVDYDCIICSSETPPNNTVLDRQVKELIQEHINFGFQIIEELEGIPFDVNMLSDNQDFFHAILEEIDETREDCQETLESYSQMREILLTAYSNETQKVILNEKQKQLLWPIVKKFKKNARPCFNDTGLTLKDVINLVWQIDLDELGKSAESKNATESEKKSWEILQNPTHLLDDLLAIHKIDQKDLATMLKKFDLGDLRFFTHEDQADVIAIKVLFNNRLNPRGLTDFFLNEINQSPNKEQCLEFLKKGQEPYYGSLVSAHHSDCWRVWRGLKLIAKLEKDAKEKKAM